MLHKYQSNAINLYCIFCKSVRHDQSNRHAWQLMDERDSDAYRVQGEESP